MYQQREFEIKVTLTDETEWTLFVYNEQADTAIGSGGLVIEQVTDECDNRYTEEEFREIYDDREGTTFDLGSVWADYCDRRIW